MFLTGDERRIAATIVDEATTEIWDKYGQVVDAASIEGCAPKYQLLGKRYLSSFQQEMVDDFLVAADDSKKRHNAKVIKAIMSRGIDMNSIISVLKNAMKAFRHCGLDESFTYNDILRRGIYYDAGLHRLTIRRCTEQDQREMFVSDFVNYIDECLHKYSPFVEQEYKVPESFIAEQKRIEQQIQRDRFSGDRKRSGGGNVVPVAAVPSIVNQQPRSTTESSSSSLFWIIVVLCIIIIIVVIVLIVQYVIRKSKESTIKAT